MPRSSKPNKGLTLAEVLVALGVVLLFLAITRLVYRRVSSRTEEDVDVSHMRRIYVALSVYEAANDEEPAPDLLTVRKDVDEDRTFLSNADPWATSESLQSENLKYPVDPERPTSEIRSPIRISFGYIVDFMRSGDRRVPSWPVARLDPRIGLISSAWHGNVHPTGGPYEAVITGLVLRVVMDGALVRYVGDDGDGRMGNVSRLFLKR